ncbi:MAG: GNAT family N-acetyltransferase [Oscillospiraceae bacterium]|nr:GNAT family N-acetyltransferase [Oscillospiraceae bacterium]
MRIRKMAPDDYESVYDLWGNTPGIGLNAADDSKEGIEKYLLRNPNTCFVAEKDGGIIGVILSGHDGRRGLIYHMAVNASEKGRGVGSALLEHALESLKNEGIAKVYIMVFKDNVQGNSFWEKRGFTVPVGTLYRAKEIMPIGGE